MALYRVAQRLHSPGRAERIILALFLVVVNYPTPSGWFMAGVRTRVPRIGAAGMVAEGRELVRQYRIRHADPASKEAVEDRTVKSPYPPHLAALDPPPAWIWLSHDRVSIKINGLGTFEGFIITADDTTRCEGIRIADGLYWQVSQ